MPIRLTEVSRRAICTKALAHALDEKQKKLDADLLALANDVYRDIYDEADRRKMARLPVGWLPERESLEVEFGSTYTNVSFGTARRIKYVDKGRCAKQYDAKHSLSHRHHELEARRKELKAQRKDLELKVMATLKSVTTVKRLYEVWPESRQFTDGISFEIANLPALPVKELNRLLGIAA